MIPRKGAKMEASDSIPRESGDDPVADLLEQLIDTYSPRERG